jgi:uncharacterized protein with HEPN domain
MRHDYASISDPLIWNVIKDELPPLKVAIEAIAATLNE